MGNKASSASGTGTGTANNGNSSSTTIATASTTPPLDATKPAVPALRSLTLNKPLLNNNTKKLSPPSMEGTLWRLNESANCWVRNRCVLDKGVISSKGGFIQLQQFTLESFRLVTDLDLASANSGSSSAESASSPAAAPTATPVPPTFTMALPAAVFMSALKNKRSSTGSDEDKGPAEGVAVMPGDAHNNIDSINLAEMLSVELTRAGLNGSAPLAPPGCSALFLLRPAIAEGEGSSSGSGRSSRDTCICLVLDSTQEPVSWLMAMRTHMNYFGGGGLVRSPSPGLPPLSPSPLPQRSPSPSSNIPARKRGYACKQGRHLIKTWHCRLVVLDEGVLSYYERPLDIYPYGMEKKGEVVLSTFEVRGLYSAPPGAREAAIRHFQLGGDGSGNSSGNGGDITDSNTLFSSCLEFHSEALGETFVMAFVEDNAVAGSNSASSAGAGAVGGGTNTTGLWRNGSPSMSLQQQISVSTLDWPDAIQAHSEYAKTAGLS